MVGIVVGLFLRKEDEMADACFTIYAGWGGRFVVTGWSVLVALCLMIQKVWKWVKSFMVVAIDFLLRIESCFGNLFNFLCCVRFTGLTMLIYIIWLYVDTLDWILRVSFITWLYVDTLDWILRVSFITWLFVDTLGWILRVCFITWLFVDTLGWILRVVSWFWRYTFLLLCIVFIYSATVTLYTLPPKNSVECSHQVFKWSHLRICCKLVSKKWVTNQEMSDKSRNE